MNKTDPKTIYIETTTRCNLRCSMCLKFAEGSCIGDKDMELSLFKKILPALGKAKRVILNGIGEPLLHADLLSMITLCRNSMPAEGEIGFQSNGLLLSNQLAESLLKVGLNTICLSLDSLESQAGNHSGNSVNQALENILRCRKKIDTNFKIGLEIVISKENISELPDIVQWAGHRVDYILVSHQLPYSTAQSSLLLQSCHTREAFFIFDKWQKKARKIGGDLHDILSSRMKFIRTSRDTALVNIYEKMQLEAKNKDVHLNLSLLAKEQNIDFERVETIFTRAKQVAAKYSIDLKLPPLFATKQRNCKFLEDKSCFIDVDGNVSPCYFLWHSHDCIAAENSISISSHEFGNIGHDTLLDIWNRKDFSQFRNEGEKYDYPHCTSCTQGPCDDLVNISQYGANDCYGSTVPCGHCMWNLGGLRCL